MTNDSSDRARFIQANTSILTPPLVPEIKLHLADEAVPLWMKAEEQLGEIGLPPPFWAFAWAGGQALARYVLDHPDIVRGYSVLDLASGSGLVAIAATMSGAVRTRAADVDAYAAEAIAMNADLNGASIAVVCEDILTLPAIGCDVILVGDLFYEKSVAARVYAWLVSAKSRGACVWIGDPGRSYLPKDLLCKVAEYNVPVTRDLEDAEIKRTAVWTLK